MCTGAWWFLYSRDAGVGYRLEEYRATLRNHFDPAKIFLHAVVFVSLGSFIQGENTRYELLVYRGKYVCDKLPGAPCEIVAESLDVVYNGDVDDGDWAVAELEHAPGGIIAGHAWEFRELTHRIQEALGEADVEDLQNIMEDPPNVMELLSRMGVEFIAATSPATTSNLARLEAQRNALHEAASRSQQRLLVRESKLGASLNNVKAKVAKLRTCLYASVALDCCLE